MTTKVMKYLTYRADTFAHQRSFAINFLPFKSQSSILQYHNFTKTRIHADTGKAAASAIATSVATSNRAADEEPDSSVRNRDSFVDDNKNLACHSNSRMRKFYLNDCDVNGRNQKTGYNNNGKESIQSCNDNDTTPGWKFRSLKNRSCSKNTSLPSSSSSSPPSSSSSVHGCRWSPISPMDPLVWPSSVSAFPVSMRSTEPTETPIYDCPHYMAALIGPTDSGYSSEEEHSVDVDDAKDKDSDEPEAEWTLPFYMEGDVEQDKNDEYVEHGHQTSNGEEETAIVTMASIASFVSSAFSFESKESTKASDDDDNPSFKVVTRLRQKLERTEHEARLAKANLSDLVLSQIGGQHGWWPLSFAYGQDGVYSLW
ncbi:hypothetical protein BGZ80_000409 [Entomortierella chlamydospora]|uniref:Uncharacterized protein n=1 Tax=Entomortierella chlamydospora TaxID=101097 RepID=A0A9P6SYL7_9FUNG|nr:hypothetical protein BGZ79_004620 [Entomortierella chlamydospora]KAG0011815.1 hypothetical protein BGZ80_000409 [Entomortierella chlamydospora]